MAGYGPGILLCVTMMILVSWISKKRGYLPIRTRRLSSQEFIKAAKPAILPLCLPLIIIGGVRIGLFTATESGAVAIAYAILLGFMYRELKPEHFIASLKETVISTSTILMIVGAASVFSWVLTSEMVPQRLAEWMIATIQNKWVFLIAVDILLIIVGMFVEGNASMIVLAPLFAPVAKAYGIDDIHFAMVFVFGNAIGALDTAHGNADVYRVRHYKVQDQGFHQGGNTVLHADICGPGAAHLLPDPFYRTGGSGVLIKEEDALWSYLT